MQCVPVLLVAVLLCMIHNTAAPQHAIQYARTAKKKANIYIYRNAATQPRNAFFCVCLLCLLLRWLLRRLLHYVKLSQVLRHTYIHTDRQTDIHTYMHAYIHTYIHTCIHTYIHAYLHTYMHACIYMRLVKSIKNVPFYWINLLITSHDITR
jgi:hypothetical protein